MPSNFSSVPNCSRQSSIARSCGDEIAPIAGEILEVAGAEIVDHRQSRREFLLQLSKIGTDEAGATGDEEN